MSVITPAGEDTPFGTVRWLENCSCFGFMGKPAAEKYPENSVFTCKKCKTEWVNHTSESYPHGTSHFWERR